MILIFKWLIVSVMMTIIMCNNVYENNVKIMTIIINDMY